MGCDIHLYVERREGNRWWKVKDGFKSSMYDESRDYFSGDKFKDCDSPYSDRDYTVFAYLADVRNGYGFAGCDTGNAIKPIAQPRGLPEDVSLTLKDDSDWFDADGHSHSYLTLRELKTALEKSKKIGKIYRGYVDKKEYQNFKEKGKAESYCGFVSGMKINHVSNEKMDSIIKENIEDGDKEYFTQIEWEEPLIDAVKEFFDIIIPALEDVEIYFEEPNDDNRRIVFWFDN